MPDPENLAKPRKQAPPRQRSTERGGLGQSGYTAGRREGDLSLGDAVDTRNVGPPGSGTDGLGTDDRFTGRGGPVGDVERDGPGEAIAQPDPRASGAPDPGSEEPDGASGRWEDREDRDDRLDRSVRPDRGDD
jgi:hypothetical protein